jgi:hypothetical protein
MNSKNSPLIDGKNTPLALERQYNVPGVYNKSAQIAEIALFEYKKHGSGITYVSLLDTGIAQTKTQAQNILKHHRSRGTLFTLSDTRPQIYYPSCLRSEILKRQIQKNMQVDPIGVVATSTSTNSFSVLKNPLSQCFDYMANYTLVGYVLPLLPEAPLLVHNLHFKTKIIAECYSELKLPSYRRNNGKLYEEIIGKTKVDYVIYASGAVIIHTTCSNFPFKVETEEDRLKLVAFFGQIRAGLINLLKDKHERIVPNISEWEITECDFNKDIKITDYFHMTALKVRIRHLDHLLGIYVKAIGEDTVLRVEETKHNNLRLVDFITDTFNPMAHIQSNLFDLMQKISEMYDIITKLSASQSSTEVKKEV